MISYLNATVGFHLPYVPREYFKNTNKETIKWQKRSIYETVTKLNQKKYLAGKFQVNKPEEFANA